MKQQYNAYITYEHSELNNKISEMIETKLKYYPIPKKLLNDSDTKKIEKIFRYPIEPPINNTALDNINNAILTSEYMIVVCSPETAKSDRITQEIKLFLQDHTIEHILAVISDGETCDVIPEILKSKKIIRKNSNGSYETVHEPHQPMTFDFRASNKSAVRKELPRLLATITGCSYEGLVQKRQFKQQIIYFSVAAVCTIALFAGFANYMIKSRQQVEEKYTKSLEDRSQLLANGSDKKLANNERFPAIQLALEALPNESNPDCPVTPEAERSITKASLAYVSNSSAERSSVWNYKVPQTAVQYYEVSGDGKYLAATDLGRNIMIWDTETNKNTFSLSAANYSGISFIQNNMLLLTGANELCCVDAQTGKTLWNVFPQENETYDSENIIVSGKTFLVPNTQGTVYVFSAADGKLTATYKPAFESEEVPTPEKYIASPSDERFAYIATLSSPKDTLVLFDPQENTTKSVSLDTLGEYNTGDYISDVFWQDEKNIYIKIYIAETTKNSKKYGKTIQTENHSDIVCLTTDDLRANWKYDFSYTTIPYNSELISIPAKNIVYVYEGNMFRLLDYETGEVMNSYDLNSSIINMHMSGCMPDPVLVTSSGCVSQIQSSAKANYMESERFFPDNIDRSAEKNGFFVHIKDSDEIIQFKDNVYDSNLKTFENCPDFYMINPSNTFVSGNTAVVLSKEKGTEYASIFDATTKKFITKTELGYSEACRYEILDVYEDKIFVSLLSASKKNTITAIDAKTGDKKDYAVSTGDSTLSDSKIYFDHGAIAYKKEQNDQVFIEVCDLATEKKNRYLIPSEIVAYDNLQFDYSGGIIYLSGQNGDYIITLDGQSAKKVQLSEKWGKTTMVSLIPGEQRIVIAYEASLLVKDYSANTLYEIKCPDLEPYCASIYAPEDPAEKKILLIPYDQGFLYRYDAETGEYLGQSELTADHTGLTLHNIKFDYYKDSGLLYIQQGTTLNILNTSRWLELTAIKSCFGYNSESDTFIVSFYDENKFNKLGFFKHYTLEELIQKGKNIIGDIEMSDEMKAEYGID